MNDAALALELSLAALIVVEHLGGELLKRRRSRRNVLSSGSLYDAGAKGMTNARG